MRAFPAVCAVVVLTVCPLFADDKPETPSVSPDDRHADHKLFEPVASNFVLSLEYASKSDEAMDKMLLDGKDKLAAAFTAAKMAWMENRPSKAISILEDIVRKRGKEKSGQQFNLPANVLGNWWIAAIARHYGDAERAERAYEDILKEIAGDKDLMGGAVYCYLYKAETEAVLLKRKDLALETLGKIKSMPSAFGPQEDQMWNVFQEWADYQIAVLNKGVSSAQSSLKGNPLKSMVLEVMIDAQLFIQGITASPMSNFYSYSKERGSPMKLYVLQQAIEIGNAPIDKSLAQFHLGYFAERGAQPVDAEKYYADLFDGESFFAPEGGLHLAKCQEKQGKVDESKKTLAKIKERFPGYSKLVDSLPGK